MPIGMGEPKGANDWKSGRGRKRKTLQGYVFTAVFIWLIIQLQDETLKQLREQILRKGNEMKMTVDRYKRALDEELEQGRRRKEEKEALSRALEKCRN